MSHRYNHRVIRLSHRLGWIHDNIQRLCRSIAFGCGRRACLDHRCDQVSSMSRCKSTRARRSGWRHIDRLLQSRHDRGRQGAAKHSSESIETHRACSLILRCVMCVVVWSKWLVWSLGVLEFSDIVWCCCGRLVVVWLLEVLRSTRKWIV